MSDTRICWFVQFDSRWVTVNDTHLDIDQLNTLRTNSDRCSNYPLCRNYDSATISGPGDSATTSQQASKIAGEHTSMAGGCSPVHPHISSPFAGAIHMWAICQNCHPHVRGLLVMSALYLGCKMTPKCLIKGMGDGMLWLA